MSELRAPLREHLDVEPSPAAVEETWHAIAARRARPRTSRLPWAVAAAAVAALVFVVVRAPSTTLAPPPVSTIDVPSGAFAPEILAEPDGTRIAVMPGGRLVPIVRRPEHVEWRVARGEVFFDVAHMTARRFVVDCGLAEVAVVGTRFGVTVDDEVVRVGVEHGVVEVTAAGRVERVAAGEAIEVRGTAPTIHRIDPSSPPPAARALDPEPPDAPPAKQREVGKAAPRPADPTGPEPPEPVEDRAPDPLATADRARAEGRTDDAIAVLSTFVESHPDDPQAGLASFMLGRLWQEDRAEPARAADEMERAIRLGLPKAIEERALARIVECAVRANDKRRARDAARRYLDHHPNGRSAAEIRRWVPNP